MATTFFAFGCPMGCVLKCLGDLRLDQSGVLVSCHASLFRRIRTTHYFNFMQFLSPPTFLRRTSPNCRVALQLLRSFSGIPYAQNGEDDVPARQLGLPLLLRLFSARWRDGPGMGFDDLPRSSSGGVQDQMTQLEASSSRPTVEHPAISTGAEFS